MESFASVLKVDPNKANPLHYYDPVIRRWEVRKVEPDNSVESVVSPVIKVVFTLKATATPYVPKAQRVVAAYSKQIIPQRIRYGAILDAYEQCPEAHPAQEEPVRLNPVSKKKPRWKKQQFQLRPRPMRGSDTLVWPRGMKAPQ